MANGNDPSPGNVTEEKRAKLDEFIAKAKILISSLGYRAFEPADDAKSLAHNTSKPTHSSGEPTLVIEERGASGEGRQTSDGFVVLKGSNLRAEVTDSAPDSVRKARERLASRVEGNVLKQDTVFSSPSAASSFLMGTPTSGKVYWETIDGVSLGALEAAELQAAAGEM
ncbi:DUF4357 domain-containing protein [Corynebacterium sp. UMB2355A]|uniref:DUF4357 domain-containing protein n=1 Tax=Corynebacterium sp. UMB2355A TaxID=3081222 RepID=UPI0029FF237D|nr:DUF4357 domain-containing protein [Corynebacterium sp. UMB2355A]WPJ91817.1 DUF4357 domain-containing protein [Corynebacterium sp. UMB2355A]